MLKDDYKHMIFDILDTISWHEKHKYFQHIETLPVKATKVRADPRYHPRTLIVLLCGCGWMVIVELSWEWSQSCVIIIQSPVHCSVGGEEVGCKHL